MGNHDTLTRCIKVPTLLPAVLNDEILILIQIAFDAKGLVGRSILLVKHRQSIVCSRLWRYIVYPTHKYLFIGRITRRRETVVVEATRVHNVPAAKTVMVAVARVIEVGQAQAMAEFMGKGSDTVDGRTRVITGVQLVEHRKHVNDGVARVGTEGTITAHTIIGSSTKVPVAGPDRLGIRCGGICFAHAGIDNDDHIAVVVAVGIIRLE